MVRTFTFIIAATALVFTHLVLAIADSSFAPVFEENAGGKVMTGTLRFAKKNVPAASSVPVPAYPGAKIFTIHDIPSASDSFFQNNSIVYLSSTDSVDAVQKFYREKLSSWNHTTPKNGGLLITKVADQPWWGGNQPLKGPRVQIIDPNDAEQTKMAFPVKKLSENISGQNAVVKITFESERSALKEVDIPKVTAACVKHETEIKMKYASAGNEKSMMPTFQRMAQSSCDRLVKQRCEKDAQGRFCQKAVRKYLG